MHVSYPCRHNMILIMVDCNVFIALEIFRQWITKTNTPKCKRPTFFNLPSELETTVFLYINQLSFGQSIYPTYSSRFHPTDSLQSKKYWGIKMPVPMEISQGRSWAQAPTEKLSRQPPRIPSSDIFFPLKHSTSKLASQGLVYSSRDIEYDSLVDQPRLCYNTK